MSRPAKPRVALVWAQLAPYHVDRCEAVGRRLDGQAEVLAVELASASHTYEWVQSGPIASCSKVTLFAGCLVESLSARQRFTGLLRALWGCRTVFLGIGYNDPAILALAWLLRLKGCQVVMMADSKFDDKDRRAGFELLKQLLLLPYSGAIVAGKRHMAYARLLGFVRRPVLPGYDCVGIDRIRGEAERALAPDGRPFAQRSFVYVGRFVAKKNLERMIEGFALYTRQAGPGARRLKLVGSGPLEGQLRRQVQQAGVADRVDFLGFRSGSEISRLLADSLALVLVSTVEQWGLVTNEALAAGIPLIVSNPVGARDLLVRNLVNGFTVSPACTQAMARAMWLMASDEAAWRRMCEGSRDRAWLADSERFADAVELLIDSAAEPAASAMRAFVAALD